jgi:hypothetical protein
MGAAAPEFPSESITAAESTRMVLSRIYAVFTEYDRTRIPVAVVARRRLGAAVFTMAAWDGKVYTPLFRQEKRQFADTGLLTVFVK